MVDQRIDTLLEQTSFLYEKQKELLDKISKTFSFLLEELDKKSQTVDKNSDEFKDIKSIYDFLAARHENLQKTIQEDIDFLSQQVKAIEGIKKMEDQAKAEEVLSMVIDKEEKLQDTQEFKDKVLHDLNESEKELKIMENDFLNALKENKLRELKLFLEASENMNEESLSCDDNCSCSEVDCSSCSSSCDNNQGVDIFDNFTKKDKE